MELISEMYVVLFSHSRASEGKHAAHVPPAPGMARAADPDGAIRAETGAVRVPRRLSLRGVEHAVAI